MRDQQITETVSNRSKHYTIVTPRHDRLFAMYGNCGATMGCELAKKRWIDERTPGDKDGVG